MNKLDEQYINLLKDILENGVWKDTRNGKVLSVFGRSIRYKFKDGKFPLLTTKKIHFKSVVSELLWFLKGRTDLRWLLEQGNTIWVGDCYKNYSKIAKSYEEPDYYVHVDDPNQNCTRIMTKEEFIERIKNDDKFSNEFGDLGKIYGYQWRNWDNYKIEYGNIIGNNNIDQIQNIINTLKTNPDDRRMLVSAWRPDQLDEMVLPPCHYSFQFYTRELTIEERYDYWFKNNYESGIEYNINNLPDFDNEYYSPTPTRGISLMWNQRSVDTPLGLPFNITSYALLLEIIGRIVNMIPDELIGNLGDCHIYSNQIDGVKEQISRKPYDMLPTLKMNDEFWNYKSGECGIGELNDDFNSLIKTINVNDFSIENYKSHSKIKIPLSN